ncbi:T9SS type A sorting domain-containing protein [Flavobacterium laiguense]|uniref:Secretion system C-terminal sorting domain-containing protein n=1 Tax=Flavobacterium laiguense TaxID=2169409 RepID=A0A2U1JS84_9FLAO|nr:T9SS type A sorting domain-containing protein [Flavobacterium laiguense]PWA08066.1 hypothetical protein DB891_12775 [Flavobacterium laiguense]
MKKILLCLFLLTSISFYSQVANMTHCAGDTTFNLPYHNSLLIGNLNPAETTVSYHLTATDASNGANVISNPTNFIVPQSQRNLLASQTIYARINHLGNITTNYFSLIVNADFFSVAIIDPINCYNNAIINLDIIGGAVPFVCLINGTPNTDPIFYGNNFNPTRLHIRNLVAGTYNIEIIDAIGCLTRGSWTIEPSSIIPLDTPTVAVINATCKGSNNGAININTSGGKSPFSYSINDGVTYVPNNTFTNLAAGNYTVYVKDTSDCIQTTNTSVTEPNLLQTSAALTKPIDCVSNATVTVTATGGTAPYTYSKDGITFVQSNVFDNLVAGTYTSYVKDANGCINQNSVVISPLISLSATITKTDVLCNGNNDGSITVNAIGGQTPYQYSINNGTYTTGNSYTTKAGTYTIKVKDANGCIAQLGYVITEPAALNTTAMIVEQTAAITATGGTLPYQYSLDGVNYQASNVFPNLAPGNYIFRARDSQGCGATIPATILPVLTSTAIITKQLDCNSNAEIAITASGGQAPYQYSIDGGMTFQTSNVFNNLTTGTYTAAVKDTLNTVNYANTIIIAPPMPVTATLVIAQAANCGESATVTITATAGKAPYLYSFDGSNTFTSVNTATGLTAGTHSLFVKDANGCLAALSVVIAPSSSLSATFTTTNPYCSQSKDGKITLTATGGTTPYTYSIGNGYVASNIFNNLSAGYYTVNVKDALGCLYTMVATIVEPTILSMTASTTNSTTSADNDGTITLNATGGVAPYTYAITDSGFPINSFQTSNIFTGLKAGSYDVEVRDAVGCIYLQTNITIVNKSNSLVATTAVTPTTCLNPTGTITVSVSGGVVPYQYSVDNGINFVPSNVFSGLTPGTYSIKVRDAENNITSIFAVITPINAPSVSATVNSNVLCKGDHTGSITAAATGGQAPYTYSLNGGAFNVTNTFTNLYVGSSNITVKDTNGCIATTTLALSEPATSLSATAIAINDQGIIVNAEGGTSPYLYYLQNNNGIVVAGPQTDGIFTRLTIGSYSAQVTDANGCGYIHWSVNVVPAPALSATADVRSINCIDAGTITVNATGGFQPYYYSFDNGATYTNSNVYSSFTPGNYAIKVRDYQNTTFSIVAMITQGSVPVINVTTTNINCKGEANGSITANVTGGLAPYTYSLDNSSYINGNNSMIFTNLYAGTHHITVKDTNGCLTTTQVVISEPVSALMTVTTVKNQTITINASGGAGNYKYSISPNLDKFSTNNIFSGLTPGSYIVNTSDVNGCYITMNAVVDPPAPLINGQIKLTLEFKPGQTLADLIINGQNIKWYINQNPLAGKTSKTSEIPLPLTTVIEEGTTYYASQTINGIESTERLAVTVKSGTLGTDDLIIKNFTYYPNPVRNVLSISNDSVIDEVTFISIKGETLLTQKINSLRSEIDLSNFSKGVYFLKVKSGGAEKTVKIIKE